MTDIVPKSAMGLLLASNFSFFFFFFFLSFICDHVPADLKLFLFYVLL